MSNVGTGESLPQAGGLELPLFREPKSLTTDEVLKVARAELGLRMVKPENFEKEKQQGTKEGDYLQISNVSRFLGLKDPHFRDAGDGAYYRQIRSLIKRGFLEKIDNIDKLAERYDENLRKFLNRSLDVSFVGFFDEKAPVSLEECIKMVIPATPGILLLKIDRSTSTDEGVYYGFGKAGMRRIDKDRIISSESLNENDINQLSIRYKNFLNFPITTNIGVTTRGNQKTIRLSDSVCEDIASMLQDKVYTMLRRAITA